VVSGKAYNEASGYALVCPITNTIKKYPFEVLLPKTARTTGAILSDQVKSVDWKKRNAMFVEKAPKKETALVQAEIVALITK
jgi:mRNA interferase MazF